MAWRPTAYLLDGELDNTIQGKVTGFMKFFGLDKPVKFNLEGNFHRDIRGSKIQLINDNYMEQYEIEEAKEYMGGFALEQIGKVGDITGGLPPYDYVKYPYIEWYSKNNGRVVLELEPGQIKFLTQPIPYIESDPIDRKEQHQNMRGFFTEVMEFFNKEENKK